MRSDRCWTKSLPWILFPKVQATFIHKVTGFFFVEFIHIHHMLKKKKKGGGGSKTWADSTSQWQKWIVETQMNLKKNKSTSTENMENHKCCSLMWHPVKFFKRRRNYPAVGHLQEPSVHYRTTSVFTCYCTNAAFPCALIMLLPFSAGMSQICATSKKAGRGGWQFSMYECVPTNIRSPHSNLRPLTET